MPQNLLNAKPQYDPRWFIWTIVFLIVTGISLVSYIVFSSTGTVDEGDLVVHAQTLNHRTPTTNPKK